METYLNIIALAFMFKSIGIKNILQIILLRISYPKATIKQIESYAKKTKFNYKIWLGRKNKIEKP
ncbi:hypothetical protein [Confluentibacter flavum]|uniref:Uncharacterized protein n=1 Tax=Confluentibacter flavum TaxID=1909700 RepID=A0A2N3HLW9_9FLAO|nr:hypothetical protein [Confluentibacter flavum]PKQ45892.1 hypothetical protein CSW08_05575 [Confluentibacter flavum]